MRRVTAARAPVVVRLHVLAVVDLAQASGSDGQRESADAENRVAALGGSANYRGARRVDGGRGGGGPGHDSRWAARSRAVSLCAIAARCIPCPTSSRVYEASKS